MSDDPTRRARALCVVAAGRRIASPESGPGREARQGLLATSGLSRAGIELALTEHLETDPSPEEISALVAAAGTAPRCFALLAANVCTAALRAVAFAAATAPVVVVRPSRRDPVIAGLLVRGLAADPAFAAAGGRIGLLEACARPASPGDEVHAYGSDAAVESLTAALPDGVVVRKHGTGMGIAVIGATEDEEEAAAALARDVVPFDQRGCLSPRMALVEGDVERAAAFAKALDAALRALDERVPRGPLDDATRAEIAMYRASIEAVGDFREGPGHAVGLDPAPRALVLPPPARVVHVAPATARQASALLETWARYVTSIGGDDGDLARAVRATAPRARAAPLGEMQRPPLDGPVDLRLG
jgi:hypothetical protein